MTRMQQVKLLQDDEDDQESKVLHFNTNREYQQWLASKRTNGGRRNT